MKPKGNEYGQVPFYDVGDRVRIWPIFKNPIGTIEKVLDADSFPITYMVRYEYHSGGTFLEKFNQDELTLFERRWAYGCNCKTCSDRHASWCNVYNPIKR